MSFGSQQRVLLAQILTTPHRQLKIKSRLSVVNASNQRRLFIASGLSFSFVGRAQVPYLFSGSPEWSAASYAQYFYDTPHRSHKSCRGGAASAPPTRGAHRTGESYYDPAITIHFRFSFSNVWGSAPKVFCAGLQNFIWHVDVRSAAAIEAVFEFSGGGYANDAASILTSVRPSVSPSVSGEKGTYTHTHAHQDRSPGTFPLSRCSSIPPFRPQRFLTAAAGCWSAGRDHRSSSDGPSRKSAVHL